MVEAIVEVFIYLPLQLMCECVVKLPAPAKL